MLAEERASSRMGERQGLHLVSVLGGAPPVPQISGPSMAYLKSTVTFECKLSGMPPPLTWELIKDSGEVRQPTGDPQEGQPVTFSLRVSERSEGQYYCRVRAGGQTTTSPALHLHVLVPVMGTYVVPEPDPAVVYEGVGFTLSCHVRKGSHLAYLWYHNKQEVTPLSPAYQLSGNTLRVDRASETHAGHYECTATNMLGTASTHSTSLGVPVVVKKYLSAPRISFTLYHHGSGYHANVSCRSERGSPPVKFQLLLDGKEVPVQQEGSLEAWFSVPVNVGMDMGTLQCRAETDIQLLRSDPLDLEVGEYNERSVPVGGRAWVVVDYLQTADSVVEAARLQCAITRGTFPLFSWSFNRSSLPSEGHSHAFTLHGAILILTGIHAGNSGYYSCRVRDSFNSNSSWLESEGVLVRNTGMKMPPVEVIAVAFCCFLLVIVVGGACCFFWGIEPKPHQDGDNDREVDGCAQTNSETDRTTFQSAPPDEETDTVVMEAEV
ncbi:hypothetical protein NFI96_005683 [Prochilodus magdalenae]|nr:hypothetical protein NFI96_005683 [Prochilodus magdalenae]